MKDLEITLRILAMFSSSQPHFFTDELGFQASAWLPECSIKIRGPTLAAVIADLKEAVAKAAKERCRGELERVAIDSVEAHRRFAELYELLESTDSKGKGET